MLLSSQIFFFLRAACKDILSSKWKNNNIYTVSKIQTVRKLNNPTTTLFGALSLTVVRFNFLNDSIVIKIKKPFTISFFFLKKPLPLWQYHSVQIWSFKLQDTPHLKNLIPLLMCNVFLKVISRSCLRTLFRPLGSNNSWCPKTPTKWA